MKIRIKEYKDDIPIDEIEISSENVRTSGAIEGLEDLMENIKEFGLIQPVTVFKKGDRYQLLVGQRRFRACKALRKKSIPAFIIHPMDKTTRTIISYGENVHRKNLPYEDSIQVCNKLFKEYQGTPKSKVKHISKDLGISVELVSKYLEHKLVPKEVRKYVDAGKLTEAFAFNVTAAHFPNTDKINEIASHAIKMTNAEAERAVEFSKNNPEAKISEVVKKARQPSPLIKLIIHVGPGTMEKIKKVSKKRHQTIEGFVKNAIHKSLSGEI